jgi:hypothetical protein
MMRVRFIGSSADGVRYAYAVEQLATGFFYCFAQKKFTDGFTVPMQQPFQPMRQLATARPGLAAVQPLKALYVDDLDTSGWPDGDYYVYYNNPDRGGLEYGDKAVIASGDDTTVTVRTKKPLLIALAGTLKGFPGMPDAGAPISLTANVNTKFPST